MADELELIRSLIESNWNDANTDSATPQFVKTVTFRKKQFEVNNNILGDIIVFYSLPSTEVPADLGYGSVDATDVVVLDIRSKGAGVGEIADEDSRAHVVRVRDETKRILHVLRKDKATTTYHLVNIASVNDLSNRRIGIQRFVITANLIEYNRVVP